LGTIIKHNRNGTDSSKSRRGFVVAVIGVLFVAILVIASIFGRCWFRFEKDGQASRLRSLKGEIIIADTSRMRFGMQQMSPLIGKLESVEYVLNDYPCCLSIQVFVGEIKSVQNVQGQVVEGTHRTAIMLTPNDLKYIKKYEAESSESSRE